MADLNTPMRDNESGLTITIIPQDHRVKAIISLTRVRGIEGAVSTVWQGEMPRDMLTQEPTVKDYMHELLHLLAEFDVCRSNPSL